MWDHITIGNLEWKWHIIEGGKEVAQYKIPSQLQLLPYLQL